MKYARELIAAPFSIIKNFLLYRHILAQMVAGEIKGRFAGSMGGIIWHFVHPLLMMVIYYFVFVHVFRMRVSASVGAGASGVYLMAGLFPWMIMVEGLVRGTTSLHENAGLIQKTFFPTEILTAKAVIAPFFSYGIAIALLTIYACVQSGRAVAFVVVPFVLILQLLFTLGIAFLSAALTVFFRDMAQLMQLVVNIWIYITPILYPLNMLPDWARSFMYANPLYPFMATYQSLVLGGTVGGWHMLAFAAGWAVLFFVCGSFVFTKLKYEFADWL